MKNRLLVIAAALSSVVTLEAQGDGWSSQPGPSSQNLYGVASSDRDTWVAVGAGGTILRTIDGGSGWNAVSSPVVDALRGVSFHGSIGLAVGISGRVLRTTDAGLHWALESRPTTKNLYAVAMQDTVAVITGEEGTILVSTDAGLTWSSRTAGTASILFGVSMKGATAVGVGGQGAIVMSADAAQGWGLTVLGPPQQLFFYGTSFMDPSTGWAVGAYTVTGSIIVKSTDAGFVWSAQSAPTTNTLMGVSFAAIDTGTAVGFNGTIVHTTDGGATWTAQQSNTSQALNAVAFLDSRTGIAVGDSGTILRTVTGGLTGVAGNGPSPSPTLFTLFQNYPNPFNPSTTIGYALPVRSAITLAIYNTLGQQVVLLVEREEEAGFHQVRYDASKLASGCYFYSLHARSLREESGGDFVQTRSLMLVR